MHEKEKLVRVAEAKEHSIQVLPTPLTHPAHANFVCVQVDRRWTACTRSPN